MRKVIGAIQQKKMNKTRLLRRETQKVKLFQKLNIQLINETIAKKLNQNSFNLRNEH